jgi:glutaredoxin/glutathione-dependent peroxiredoxin
MASLFSRAAPRAYTSSLTASRRLYAPVNRPSQSVFRRYIGTAQEQPRLRLGSIAPNFKAETTQGPIDFHQWLGGSWAILFSHPADFTPVCTTELGAFAKLRPEFEKRGVKMIGLSADPLEDHNKWIQGTSGGPFRDQPCSPTNLKPTQTSMK